MAAKPLTTEAIALTEKKMDMTLDDIIKMSKNTSSKPKKQQRASNKSEKSFNNASLDKSVKVRRHYMDSRSLLRQAALAQRRSNFQGNQFPLAAEHARKAVVAPIRSRPFNHSRAMNVNTPRVGAPPVQRRVVHGGFIVKKPPQQQVKVLPKQRPQTLDSLFANMKEQRMRVLSQQNNTGRRNGGGQQRQQWGRGHFGN